MDQDIGIGEAAKILGVSVSTLKRLCDERLLESVRTPGGHRRFKRAEVEMAGQRMSGNASRYLTDIRTGTKERLAFTLMAGNEHGTLQLLEADALISGSMVKTFDSGLVPALRSMAQQPLTDAQMRLAEQTAMHVTDRWIAKLPIASSTKTSILGIAVDVSQSEIASKLVEAAMRANTIHARHVGSVSDLRNLIDLAVDSKVAAVWLANLHECAFKDLVTHSQALREALPKEICTIVYSASLPNLHTTLSSERVYYNSLTELSMSMRSILQN